MGNPKTRVPFDRAKLLMPAGIVVLAAMIYIALTWPLVAAGLGLAIVYAFALAKVGVWRTMMGTSIVVSILRSGPPAAMLGEGAW